MRRQVNIAALLSGCGPRAPKQIELPVASPLRLDGLTIVDTGNGELTPGMSILMDSGSCAPAGFQHGPKKSGPDGPILVTPSALAQHQLPQLALA
jgi:hypothetical protein